MSLSSRSAQVCQWLINLNQMCWNKETCRSQGPGLKNTMEEVNVQQNISHVTTVQYQTFILAWFWLFACKDSYLSLQSLWLGGLDITDSLQTKPVICKAKWGKFLIYFLFFVSNVVVIKIQMAAFWCIPSSTVMEKLLFFGNFSYSAPWIRN